LRAIILAGGKGTRLKPYTTFIPKPLVPIGGEFPILEIIIKQLKQNGFNHITLAVNHLAEFIQAFFRDGSKWDIKIDYSLEETPLGTIGPLTLISDLPENFLVMNGDILSDINFAQFIHKHEEFKRRVSVACFNRVSKVDFGVIEAESDGRIVGFKEKPEFQFEVSMGIYALNREVVTALQANTHYGFDTLMIDGIAANKNHYIHRHKGFWLDIGRPDDYDYCNENYQEIRDKLKF
jgi:NDP-sugar pyrophosphorylase family protein